LRQIPRHLNLFFVTFAAFCKPFRIKQKQTKETKICRGAEKYIGLSYTSTADSRDDTPLQEELFPRPVGESRQYFACIQGRKEF
jgi:hypothetical protein